jgi:hypothetical protein
MFRPRAFSQNAKSTRVALPQAAKVRTRAALRGGCPDCPVTSCTRIGVRMAATRMCSVGATRR